MIGFDEIKRDLKVTDEQAEEIEELIDGPMGIEPMFKKLAEILGDERQSLRDENAWTSHYWEDTIALYVNRGGSYQPTLLYDLEEAKMLLVPWEAWYEDWEAKNVYTVPDGLVAYLDSDMVEQVWEDAVGSLRYAMIDEGGFDKEGTLIAEVGSTGWQGKPGTKEFEFDGEDIDIIMDEVMTSLGGEFTAKIRSVEDGVLKGTISTHDIPAGSRVTIRYVEFEGAEDLPAWGVKAVHELLHLQGYEPGWVDEAQTVSHFDRECVEVEVESETWMIAKSEGDADYIATKMIRDDLYENPEIFIEDFLKPFWQLTPTDLRVMVADEYDRLYEDAQYDLDDADEDELVAHTEKAQEDFEERLKDDALGYFMDDMGYSWEDLLKENVGYIDGEAAAAAAINADGIGHFLSSYDGETDDLPSGTVIWRTN